MSVSDFSVNKQPTQLLRLLGLSGPDAPNRLADAIGGELDLLPWILYANSQVLSLQLIPGIGTVGFGASTLGGVVPDGVRWIVTSFSVRCNCAGATVTASVSAAYDQPLTGGHVHALGQPTPVATGPSYYSLGALKHPSEWVILSQGDRLGFNGNINSGAAAPTYQGVVRYVQFAI